MQSPGHRDYYHHENDKQRQDDSPTRANEEQQVDLPDESSSTLTAAKNKKRVHYPQSNGEHLAQDTSKTDCLKSDPDSSTLGKRRCPPPHRQDIHSLHLVDLYSKTNNGSTPSDHVIPIEKPACATCCCSPSKSTRRRFDRFLNPWREFIAYQSSWSWVILVASFLTYSIGEALTSVFPILFVALQAEFPDKGSSRIALVHSMMNAVPCLLGPVASIATTRFGYRKTTMLGGLITSLSLLATSFASRLEILYITMGICYAFGNSLVLVATVVAVTEHFEAKPSFASGVTISGKSDLITDIKDLLGFFSRRCIRSMCLCCCLTKVD